VREHKTAWKTGKPRRIPIGRKLGELLTQAIGDPRSPAAVDLTMSLLLVVRAGNVFDGFYF